MTISRAYKGKSSETFKILKEMYSRKPVDYELKKVSASETILNASEEDTFFYGPQL